MRRYLLSSLLAGSLAVGGAFAASQPAAGWNNSATPAPNGGSVNTSACAAFSSLSATFTAAPGATNGTIGIVNAGESYTITVSGPGTGSFRLVGSGSGVPSYAGPASVPGALTFTIPSHLSRSSGIGYYFDSGSGVVTLTASCNVTNQIPSTNVWGASLMALLLVIGGAATFAARHKNNRA